MKVTLPFLVAISAFSTTVTTRSQDAVTVNLTIQEVYSGPVVTAGRFVTTNSGGTHLCDGTNHGANPMPGGTPTTALADAADHAGFTFNANWSEQNGDFVITEIRGIACSNWAFTVNGQSVKVGGCQVELKQGDTVSWGCAH